MENLQDIVFEFKILLDEGEFGDIRVKHVPKEISINLNRGDIIQLEDEIYCVDHKKYTLDTNGFHILTLYLIVA